MQTRSGSEQKDRYTGTLRLEGASFPFATCAVSEAEATNNGIAQYAKQINWSIGKLRGRIKAYGGVVSVVRCED